MLHEIRGFRVLEGYRGHPPADLRALENLLLQVSRFIEENPSIQELDLNPVFAYAEGAVAVDARIVVGAELTDLNTEAR
jgi:acyl-CoA synthetase (NDP forming)